MFLEILIAIIIGLILGTFTGLIPGVHINLVAAIILSLSVFLLQFFSPISLAAAIMAMAIMHVFVDFIPSIFLGAPSDATALAVLPGHQLLIEGRGYEAVILSAIGGFFGVVTIISLLPVLLFFVTKIFAVLRPHIGIILLGILIYNIFREKGIKRWWSFVVISMAGALGFITLNIPNMREPLLPLLASLFGVSMLIVSGLENTAVPIQVREIKIIKPLAAAKSVAAGTFSGGLMGLFPALGPAQAAMLARELLGKSGKRAYLMTIGAVSTSSMLFGLITLFAIDKARNGSIAILSEIVSVGIAEFVLLISVAVVACGAAFIITSIIAKFFSRNIYRIDYTKISVLIIVFISALTFYFSQFVGLLILATGTAIGFFTINKNIARHNLMSCLMVPVMGYYLF